MPPSNSGRLIAGTIAFMLIIGTLFLYNTFLNRIHSARKTGESYAMFFVGGQSSLKDYMKLSIRAIVDLVYIVSNGYIISIFIDATGRMIFAISTNSPDVSIIWATAIQGFVLGLLTVFIGYKHIITDSHKYIPVHQRFVSGVTAGVLLSIIIAFVIVIGSLTPVSIITGLMLIGIGVVLIYIIPTQVKNDVFIVLHYGRIFTGVLIGGITGGGVILALYTQTISVSSLLLIGTYCSLIWFGLFIFALFTMTKAVSQIDIDIFEKFERKKLSFFRRIIIVGKVLLLHCASNVLNVGTAVVVLINFRSTVGSFITSFSTFHPKEVITSSIFLLVIILVGIIKPKFLFQLIPFIDDEGLNPSETESGRVPFS